MRYCFNMSKTKNLGKSQTGFSIIEILVVIIVIAIIAGAGVVFISRKTKNPDIRPNNGQNSQQNNQSSNSKVKDEADLVIHNFGVESLDSIDITTNATRDFTKSGHKGFYVFGDILPGTPVRHNPNYEFASMKEGTKLISAIDGIVGFIKEQTESNDYEVFLMTSEQSNWIIGYDHVTDLKVKKGDKVKVGDVLGSPARQNNGLLRYEFQVNKNDGNKEGMHICPSTLLSSDVRDKYLKQLSDMQNSWESISGLELYDLAKQQPAGCIEKQMTPSYANGQTN